MLGGGISWAAAGVLWVPSEEVRLLSVRGCAMQALGRGWLRGCFPFSSLAPPSACYSQLFWELHNKATLYIAQFPGQIRED